MKLKANYFVIPFLTIFTAWGGSLITTSNMDWYNTLNLPPIAPAGAFIGLVWTIIFILSAISALLYFNSNQARKNKSVRALVLSLFLLSAIFNVLWSAVFFGWHLLGWAVVEMIVLNLINLSLILVLWKKSLWSAILLIPYFLWVAFATYLAVTIWRLN